MVVILSLSLSCCTRHAQTCQSVSHNCFCYTSKTECAIPDDNTKTCQQWWRSLSLMLHASYASRTVMLYMHACMHGIVSIYGNMSTVMALLDCCVIRLFTLSVIWDGALWFWSVIKTIMTEYSLSLSNIREWTTGSCHMLHHHSYINTYMYSSDCRMLSHATASLYIYIYACVQWGGGWVH